MMISCVCWDGAQLLLVLLGGGRDNNAKPKSGLLGSDVANEGGCQSVERGVIG